MTVKVFWENPYQTELVSTVSWIEGRNIRLDKTIFYAESGGQAGDVGYIRGDGVVFRVIDTQKQGDAFLHRGELEQGGLQVGAKVTTSVDPASRLRDPAAAAVVVDVAAAAA